VKHLPLYPDTRALVEKVEAITETDSACTRCKLNEGARSVCLPADAHNYGPGATLVLGDYPTRAEDDARRPLSAGPNLTLREIVEEHTDGPVVYASALRCAPKARNVTDNIMKACRPYTRGLIDEVKPARILCFGKRAYQMVLGSTCDSVQLGRRGYGYLSDGTPVFMLHAPRRVSPNRFLFKRWKADIKWALDATPEPPPWTVVIQQVETVADAQAAADALRRAGVFTFDTETGGLMGSEYFQIVCLTATPADNLDASFLWGEEALKDPAIVAPLLDVMADPEVGMVGHNLKFDLKAVAYGLGMRDDRGVLTIRGVEFDTLLAVKAIDTECKGGLAIVDHHVGMGGHKAENARAVAAAVELIGRSRSAPKQLRLGGMTHPALAAAVRHPDADAKAFAYALVPRELLYRYCALDTIATARLHAKYKPVVDRMPSLKRLTDMVFNPITAAVAQIEAWGMSADIDAARSFGRLLEPRRDAALAKVRALGCDIDINSSQQLGRYLFEDLGLPVQDVSEKTGQPRVNAASLEKLRDHHEVVATLLDYSKTNKLLSTYVTGLIPHIRQDGRIRASLNIAGARSGRMSSSNPNLQNIPSTGEYAKMAKAIFNVAPGNVLLQLDYSQLEVRVAAILSGDPALVQAYLEGADVHRRTAAAAFDMAEADVTKDIRRNAKAVVFGVMYGKSARSLAKDLGVSLDRGQFIFDSVLGALPVLTEWMEDRRRFVQAHGTTWTYLMTDAGLERARCRQLWQIAELDSKVQSVAKNGSVNTPIQGTASDYMLRSLSAIVEWIIADGIPARVVNSVHDSVILEVPADWAVEVADVAKAIMESWPSGAVPLVADVDVGLTWGSLMKLDGVRLVANARRQGMPDDEIITLAGGDSDLIDAMGDDPAGWLAKTVAMAQRLDA
jgi:DNA polymerase I-like protein with 3'-5' exonuclease and polymerase domains/uracil-DNA glycosylase